MMESATENRVAAKAKPSCFSNDSSRVEFEDGFEHENMDLCRRVRNYLAERQKNSLDNLEICVDRGRVTVSGRLNTYYEKQVAINTCQRVAGVVSVIDEIRVKAKR